MIKENKYRLNWVYISPLYTTKRLFLNNNCKCTGMIWISESRETPWITTLLAFKKFHVVAKYYHNHLLWYKPVLITYFNFMRLCFRFCFQTLYKFCMMDYKNNIINWISLRANWVIVNTKRYNWLVYIFRNFMHLDIFIMNISKRGKILNLENTKKCCILSFFPCSQFSSANNEIFLCTISVLLACYICLLEPQKEYPVIMMAYIKRKWCLVVVLNSSNLY